MFRLSDATRRPTVTGLFVLLCVVPTAIVVAVGLWRCLPGRLAAEEHRLSLLLGQRVRIESLRRLRPSAVLYEGLEVRDPETDALLWRCDRVRAEHDSVLPEGSKRHYHRLRLTAGKITVSADSTGDIRPLADRLLQQRIDGGPTLVELTARELAVEGRPEEYRAHEICCRATLQAESSRVEMTLQLEGHETPKPAYFCLVRNRQYQPPVDGVDVYTGDGPLPCSFLAAVLPQFGELGDGCQFQGRLVANHTSTGWEIDLIGTLSDLDLRVLIADRLPHEISGVGTLELDRVEFRAGRVRSMQGALRAENGRISRALIASCMHRLGLNGTFPTSGSALLVPYEHLALRFHVDGSGLGLWGECPLEPKGAMLFGGYNQRLDGPDPSFGPIPLTKAVAAITSTPEDQLSVSRHAARLMQRVPFVSSAPTATIAAPPTVDAPSARH